MQKNRTTSGLIPLIAVLVVLFLLSLGFLSYGNYAGGAPAWQIVVNTLILSVPLGLFYFSIGLLAAAWMERRRGAIDPRLAQNLIWTPRIAGVLIVLFIGLFSLDVFGGSASFWDQFLAFLMHSIPAIILAVVVALAWRWPAFGAVAFLIGALFFLIAFGRGDFLQALGRLLLFSGPMLVIALMFYASWKWLQPPSTPAP